MKQILIDVLILALLAAGVICAAGGYYTNNDNVCVIGVIQLVVMLGLCGAA